MLLAVTRPNAFVAKRYGPAKEGPCHFYGRASNDGLRETSVFETLHSPFHKSSFWKDIISFSLGGGPRCFQSIFTWTRKCVIMKSKKISEFQVWISGRELYFPLPEWRLYYKSTSYHSTLSTIQCSRPWILSAVLLVNETEAWIPFVILLIV